MELFKIPMQENDADAATIGEYFKKLLYNVWDEGESFSGKRPFGNSGWEYDVYAALVKAGAVAGRFDEDGYLDDVDKDAANKLVDAALKQIVL